jgi:hypothetical protein
MQCKICDNRRPRRFCPGVGGEICSVCCGTGREETVSCPLDCPYLLEARMHDKPPEIDSKEIPNLDIKVPESFLRDNELLLAFLIQSFAGAGLSTEGAVDYDVREALDAMVRTYRTRESGLYYDSRPSNLIAATIQGVVAKNLEEFRKSAVERFGLTTIRDADVLGVLAFLQRVEYQINNGRKRGRAFLDFLLSQSGSAVEADQAPGGPSLILP